MISPSELYKILDSSKALEKEVIDILKELDITDSRVTQANLNKMLIGLRNRVIKEKDITVVDENIKFTNEHEFDAWVQNTFNTYSVQLYMDSI